jgi:hypothetical protein
MRGSVKTVLLVIGSIVGLGFVALIIWLATTPEAGVKLANDMDEYALAYLDEHDLLKADERLVAYYDVTLSMDGTEAAILTTKHVLYHKAPRSTSIPLSDVVDVQHSYESMIGDVIVVQSASGESMKIEIPPFNGGEIFLNALQNAWKQARPPAPQPEEPGPASP